MMTEFYLVEDFPKNQIEFEKRFATEKACFDYLFKMNMYSGSIEEIQNLSVKNSCAMCNKW
jgi:hypothetical protein